MRSARTMRTASALLVSAAVVVATAPGARAAETAPGADGGNTAVIGPMLDFFGFGSNVGVPLMCAVSASFVTVGFSEFQAQDQAAPFVDALEQGCAAFREQGNAYVEQGKTMQAPYADVFNPYANPMIDGFADTLTKLGTDYRDQMAPFGATVATAGSSVRFFKGSPPKTTKE